ncbi:MAG: YeeE/YedE family protein [Balneolaceae bacterium]|nr:YeeE/YedE family protein [Balneolaceae bacterium]MBO6547921.1 YeeE/YedE family protein [Balneolaceae bacterium]MBO6648434.1 YeeE/YedE family protein [Balneolaceae bacterium]
MRFIIAGIAFGFILIKSEVVSWFRIQEMFLFDSIHMYGVIGSAILVGLIGTMLIKRFNLKDTSGNEINIKPKDNTLTRRYIIGGSLFGLGWALVGACPGPLYALIGSGYLIFIVPLIAAVVGAGTYGVLQSKLPH